MRGKNEKWVCDQLLSNGEVIDDMMILVTIALMSRLMKAVFFSTDAPFLQKSNGEEK